MRRISYQCEVCKGEKGVGNRWLMGDIIESKDIDIPESVPVEQRVFPGLRPWVEEIAALDKVKHICSDQCGYTWLGNELIKLNR